MVLRYDNETIEEIYLKFFINKFNKKYTKKSKNQLINFSK